MDAYLEGRLDDRQRHQVERLLLEDDFDNDALEGLSLLTAQERKESVQRLEGELSRMASGKSSRYQWMAVAAVAVLLIAAAIWLIQLPDTSRSASDIAQAEETQDAPVLPPAVLESADETQSQEEIAESDAAEIEYMEESYDKAPSNAPVQETQAYQDTVGLVLGDVSPERLSQLDQAAMDTMGIDEALPSAANEPEQPRAKVGRIVSEPLPTEISALTGTVILQDGMPLSNVNVLVDGTQNTTFSNEKGKFNIAAESDATLEFRMSGLEAREVSGAELSTNNNVVMRQESVTLSELEISTPANEAYSSQGASPNMDPDAYESYLVDNMVYPEVDEPQSGEVVIRVTIEPDGTISNTKILRSLGEPHDIEAIRLIREGPAWRPAVKKGVPVSDKVRVKVHFEGE
jgi:TonB family protein